MEDRITTPALTSCGHLYCTGCVQECKRVQGKCAVCRKSITGRSDILPVSINDTVHQDAKSLVNQYGTKMGKLIHHLNKLFAKSSSEKVIIFSSRNSDLVQLGKFLAIENIKTVFCRSNVHVRKKAFMEFDDPEAKVRVMMLSLENAANGSNLTAASEVILLDSIWEGNYREQLATELQALTRAHRVGQTKRVRIVRMLIRDTVESELFKLRYPGFDQSKSLVIRDLDFRNL
jgi:SNF2 family DNA or RNA helicase